MTTTPAPRGKYFEDFKVGDEFVTSARTITSTDIVNFACLSGDFNEVHTNFEYCKTTPFGEPVAHGPLVYAIMGGLQYASGINDGTMLALLGKDSPVEVRDRALENLRLFLPGKWRRLANSKEFKQAIDNLLAESSTRIVGLRLIAATGMVDSLAARLAAHPNDPSGWVRLVRAYGVLGQSAKQAAALERARSLFAGRPDVLSELAAAARPREFIRWRSIAGC